MSYSGWPFSSRTRRLVVGEEVEAELVAGDREGDADDDGEDEDGDDRQRRAAESASAG